MGVKKGINSNVSYVTVAGVDTGQRVKSLTINPGQAITERSEGGRADSEEHVFKIRSRVKIGKTTKIGTLRVQGGTYEQTVDGEDLIRQNAFRRTPSIIEGLKNNLSDDNVHFSLTSVERDAISGDKVAFNYDVFYTARSSDINNRSKSFKLDLDVVSNSKLTWKKLSDIRDDEKGISSFDIGGDKIINPNGEKRKITVLAIGENRNFVFTIVKLTDTKDSNGNIISTTEESIVPKNIGARAIHTGPGGEEVSIFKVACGEDGKFTYYQNFKKETSETRYAVRLYAGAMMHDSFDFTLWEETNKAQTKSAAQNGWQYYASMILTQPNHPSLTLKTVTTWSNATVDSNGNGTFVTFDASNPINEIHKGRYNQFAKKIKTRTSRRFIPVVHVIKASSGAFTLRSGSDGAGGTLGAPKFSNVSGLESDWTNSIYKDNSADGFVGNGGTIVDISGISAVISTTSSSNDTITIKYTVSIEKWGTKDVTMEMDVDKIATLA